jgi:hypothetical protein
MTSSLKLWIPLTLVTGWMLGHGTSLVVSPLSRTLEPSSRGLETLEARIESLSEQLAALQSRMQCAGNTTTVGLDTASLHAELRRALREELTASFGKPESMNAAASAPARAEVSPANLAALERGQRVLEEALRARRWGDAQADELSGLFPGMTAAQQLMLAQRLSASINRGELVVETTDLPF